MRNAVSGSKPVSGMRRKGCRRRIRGKFAQIVQGSRPVAQDLFAKPRTIVELRGILSIAYGFCGGEIRREIGSNCLERRNYSVQQQKGHEPRPTAGLCRRG